MGADQQILQDIHQRIAKAFLNLLAQAEGTCPACSHEIHQPLNPAVYGHIGKFLKDNHIESLAVPGSPLDKLKKAGKLKLLPFLEDHEREAVGE